MPADATVTKQRILTAAEIHFADDGYEAVSLRAVARDAKVQIALVHYHFGSKADLYKAIWSRRYAGLAEKRKDSLPQIDFDRDSADVIRDLVDLFVMPLMGDPGGRRFLNIMAHEYSDPKEPERGIVREFIDPITLQMLAAFRRALPGLTEADLGWGYQCMTGVLMMHVVDVNRATRLTRGAAKSGDTVAALPSLKAFIVGGWLALAAKRGATGHKPVTNSAKKLRLRKRG